MESGSTNHSSSSPLEGSDPSAARLTTTACACENCPQRARAPSLISCYGWNPFMLPNRLDRLRFEGQAQPNANCMGEIKEGDGRLDYRTRSNSLITSQSWRNRKTKGGANS